MYYKNTVFLVAGLQKSGFASAKMLIEKGATVYVYDKRKTEQITKNLRLLENLGATFITDYAKAVEFCDVLVISPGVPIDSEICKTFKRAGKRITGELELGSMQINIPIIAVTGTNGKTTVCSLIHSALSKSGIKTALAGNIGTPLCEIIDKCNDSELAVVEVSSYQLETTYTFYPHVSVLLNISPDHLERHYSMENYALVKSKILLPLKESEFAVLNYDDLEVKDLARLTKAKVLYFSTKEKVDGSYVEDGFVRYKGEKIIAIADLLIKEPHNLENVLATVCVLKAVGVDNEKIKLSLSEFKGVKHRFEKVAEINGVTFINDSKSTNPDSTIKAISSLKNNAVLIIGGSEKNLDYTELFEKIKSSEKVAYTVITGAFSNGLLNYAVKVGVDNVCVVKDFTQAVLSAYKMCNERDFVLLSPATASFDEFSSFEERGERFVEIVNSLKK